MCSSDLEHVPALNNLAYLYAENYGSLDEALEMASRAYRQEPGNAGIMDTLGYVLVKKGRADEAVKLLEQAAKALPGVPAVQIHLAQAYLKANRRGEATPLLEKVAAAGQQPEAGEASRLLTELKNR